MLTFHLQNPFPKKYLSQINFKLQSYFKKIKKCLTLQNISTRTPKNVEEKFKNYQMFNGLAFIRIIHRDSNFLLNKKFF